jgi:hypothetical protein
MYVKSIGLMIKQKLDLLSKLEDISIKHLSVSYGVEETVVHYSRNKHNIINYANSVS